MVEVRRALAAPLSSLTLLLVAACGQSDGDPTGLGTQEPEPQPSTQTGEPEGDETTPAEDAGPVRPRVVGTVARNLQAPWGITFLPDDSALVGERDTTRILAIPAGGGDPREVGRLDIASPQGEAGVLGLATSPTYAEDSLVYAYVSTSEDNRVVRMEYDGRRIGDPEPVLTGIPNGFIHDGGRLLFAEDGNLFVSTGETGEEQLAQDRDSLAGKILRITPDGEPAPGNPVEGSPVWTMGHRNVQGLALDDDGRAVGQRVRLQHLGRAQPHRRGPQLRLAGQRGTGAGPVRLPRPLRPVAHLGGLPLRAGLPRGLAVDGLVARRSGCGRCRSTRRAPASRATGSSATTAGCAPSWSRPTATCG